MSDYGHDLEFGVFVTTAANAPAAVKELTVLSDEKGLDPVTFHFAYDELVEPLARLGS